MPTNLQTATVMRIVQLLEALTSQTFQCLPPPWTRKRVDQLKHEIADAIHNCPPQNGGA